MSETPLGPEWQGEATAEGASWLVKEEGECRATGGRQRATQADAIVPLTQGGPEDEVAILLTELECVHAELEGMHAELGRYRSARIEEVSRLRAELAAERRRAWELRGREAVAHGQIAAAVGVASSTVWPDLAARVAALSARPSRSEVLREAADALAEDDYLGAAEELRELADAAEQGETGGAA